MDMSTFSTDLVVLMETTKRIVLVMPLSPFTMPSLTDLGIDGTLKS